MIDLRKKGLQDTIDVDGKSFLLRTDFRIWIDFGIKIMQKECTFADILDVFENNYPTEHLDEAFIKLLEFYQNANSTPRVDDMSSSDVHIIDYVEDGEYIIGSFYQCYGIDLTSCDMHWHLFQALFRSLSEDTKIKNIMMFRSYKKEKSSQEQMYQKAKEVWTLPSNNGRTLEEKQELLQELDDMFYNS